MVEFKRVWRDEFLKELCGFANAQGGMLVLGVDDAGHAEETTLKTALKTTLKTAQKTTTKATTKTTTKTATKDQLATVLEGETLAVGKLIVQNPAMTLDELAQESGLSRDGVRYHIRALKTKAGLVRVGGRKAGHWEFKEEP
jgi:predicted HTH transcriptional regulator